jgi:hypothetical protein
VAGAGPGTTWWPTGILGRLAQASARERVALRGGSAGAQGMCSSCVWAVLGRAGGGLGAGPARVHTQVGSLADMRVRHPWARRVLARG